MLGDTLNAVRWQGKRQRGFHEVWYFTTVDPATGDAFWFRYTIDAPLDGELQFGLWAITTPAKAPKTGLALHDKMPIAKEDAGLPNWRDAPPIVPALKDQVRALQ